MEKIYPLILAGGLGDRLYPLSSPDCPKPLLTLSRKYSLLAETWMRVAHDMFSTPQIITNQAYGALMAAALPECPKRNIILEPVRRNTAASVAIGVLKVIEEASDGVLLVLPSDHLINDHDHFLQAVRQGLEGVAQNYVASFGIRPTMPHTGYGYIEKGDPLHDNVFMAKNFIEKPDAAQASAYITSGAFLWNAGIFLFSAKNMVSMFEQHAPDTLEIASKALEQASRDDFLELDASFAECGVLSFDRAIMEKIDQACIVPVEMGWRDVGTFQVVNEELDKLAQQNLAPLTSYAWGSHQIFERSPGFKAQRIIIDPNQAMVEQDGSDHWEHWVMVEGCARVSYKDQLVDLEVNQRINIPARTSYRLENSGAGPVIVIKII